MNYNHSGGNVVHLQEIDRNKSPYIKDEEEEIKTDNVEQKGNDDETIYTE